MFSFFQNERLTDEQKILVGNVQQLERERVKSHKLETSSFRNRLAESEKEIQQEDTELKREKDIKSRVEETLVFTMGELRVLRGQHKEIKSQLPQAQETINGLRNQLAESKKKVNTERTTCSQIITSLQSDLRRSSERLKECDDGLERSNEERGRLRQQYEESQSELRRAEATIEQFRQDWTISRHDIKIFEKELGRGAWGWVKEGTFRGTKVAVKQMHDIIVSQHNIISFEREMRMAAICRHPNLLQFIGATNDNAVALFVTELMDTDLRTELTQRSLKYKEVIALSLDVNLALNYLHLKDPPIVHRDVSSANVLLWKQGREWRAKLSDYGSANLIRESKAANTGARIYAAPEAMTRTQHSPKVSY